MGHEQRWCGNCGKELLDQDSHCLQCGWRDPDVVVAGKRMRLHGLVLMGAGAFSCIGSCYTVDGGPLPNWAWYPLFGFGCLVGIVGFLRWLRGQESYAGK